MVTSPRLVPGAGAAPPGPPAGGPAAGRAGSAGRRTGRVSTTGRPSATTPSGPVGGLMNAVMLVVWALRTNRAAWISSPNTTRQPRPRACGLAATVTAASRLAGPSAPASIGGRIAPGNTTGAAPAH